MATSAELKELRRKFGLGEFKTKAKVMVPKPTSSAPVKRDNPWRYSLSGRFMSPAKLKNFDP